MLWSFMGEELPVVPLIPSGETWLTPEELEDENIELIYVQHNEILTPEEVGTAVEKFLQTEGDKRVTITEVPLGTPVYAMAMNDGGLRISRPIDRYFFAAPQ